MSQKILSNKKKVYLFIVLKECVIEVNDDINPTKFNFFLRFALPFRFRECDEVSFAPSEASTGRHHHRCVVDCVDEVLTDEMKLYGLTGRRRYNTMRQAMGKS